MEIKAVKNYTTEEVGDFDSISANIADESLPFIFEMMSKSLYSNPIGSICREIGSNCFDSHVEAGVNLPVLIKKNHNPDEGYSISFIDYGVGLSPERIRTIYMNYFSSTKRATNSQIGGWGLGSKTPLSYTDLFYIITRFDGIEYNYMLHKGEQLPTLELLGQESTTERNGTEIKIPMESNDEIRFREELGKQLAYFDGVYIEGFGIDNSYKIYEGKLFKYRNKDQYSDIMHVLLGKVAYPIDWEQIGMKAVKIPVGVKFDIGELQVTPNRETLRYTDDIKKLVKTRIEETIQELIGLFNTEILEFDDIIEYLKTRSSRPHITFGDDDKLYIPVEYGVAAAYKYKPVAGHSLVIPSNPFFEYEVMNKLYQGRLLHTSAYPLTVVTQGQSFIFANALQPNVLKFAFISNALIMQRRRWNFRMLCTELGFKTADRSNVFFTERKLNFHDPICPQLGRAKAIHAYRKAIHAEVMKRATLSYDDLVLDPAWIAEYKQRTKEESLAYKRKMNQTFPVRDIDKDKSYDVKVGFIEKFRGLIIYGYVEDKKELTIVRDILKERKTLIAKRSERYDEINLNPKACLVLRVARSNYTHFQNRQNFCYVKDFMTDNKVFKDIATAMLLEGMPTINNWNDGALIEKVEILNADVAGKMNIVQDFILRNTVKLRYERRSNYREIDARDFYDSVLEIAKQGNLFNQDILDKVKDIDKWYKGAELIKFVNLTGDSIPLAVDYLRMKRKKVNKEFIIKETLLPPPPISIICLYKGEPLTIEEALPIRVIPDCSGLEGLMLNQSITLN